MSSPSDPVAVTLFGVGIRWYAIFILIGILAAIWLARLLAGRRGLDPDFLLDMAPWVVFAGIAGARLYYLALRSNYYLENPGQALNLRLGGLTIHGALVGGIGAVVFFCRRSGQPFMAWADVLIPGVALGQAIGRWGNWANQEAFGTPTGLPWGVAIDAINRPAAFAEASRFHPTFLYESLFDGFNAAFLAWLVINRPRLRFLRDGDVLSVYFVLYGTARLAIERVRTDSLYIGPLPAAYWVSLGLIVLGASMLVLRHRGGRSEADRWTSGGERVVGAPPD